MWNAREMLNKTIATRSDERAIASDFVTLHFVQRASNYLISLLFFIAFNRSSIYLPSLYFRTLR